MTSMRIEAVDMSGSVAVISDIHGNLQALQAVLADIDMQGVDERICLGDIVGYGGNPAECLDLVRAAGFKVIRGNHEAFVTGEKDCAGLNDELQRSILWTRHKLSADQIAWLNTLPLTLEGEDYQAVHASLYQPAQWHHLLHIDEVRRHFEHQVKPVCFVGHTHQPKIWLEDSHGTVEPSNTANQIEGRKQVVNVGSVGQPRDDDERTCYVIYRRKEREFMWRRLTYDIEAAQRAILVAGLPEQYAARLNEHLPLDPPQHDLFREHG